MSSTKTPENQPWLPRRELLQRQSERLAGLRSRLLRAARIAHRRVVLDMGAGGTLDTTNIDSEILAFIFGESGLMAGATLEGSKVTQLDWE